MECRSKIWNVLFQDNDIYNTSSSGEVILEESVSANVMKFICLTSRFICKFYGKDSNKVIDIAAGSFVLRENSYKYSSFPYFHSEISFAALKPDYADKTFQIFKIFSFNMWIGIIISIIIISLLNYLIFKERNNFLLTFSHVLCSLVLQYHDWKPKTCLQKLIVIFPNYGIMLITIAYTSVLLSLITMPMKKERIETVDALYQALVRRKVTVTDFENIETYRPLILSSIEKIRFIGEELKRSPEISHHKLTEAVGNDSLLVVSRRDNLEKLINDKYYIGKENIITDWVMILVTRNRPCLKVINRSIHTLWSSGIYRKIVFDAEKKSGILKRKYDQQLMNAEESTVKSLSISDLSGIFYILLFGFVLGTICLILERITAHFFQ